MDPILITAAFVCGFGGRFLGLPPLVGYLIAGFLLGALGFEQGPMVEALSDTGVYLLLFSIGLKLDLQSFARPHVWATATAHATITTALVGAVLATVFGFELAPALVIGFALSFSSTVFAVKMLESNREETSLHGRTAVGILVLQDILAVLFLVVSRGDPPSPWALALLGLIPLRRPIYAVMERTRHGELLVLFGVTMALGLGATLFGAVGLKPDLGALVVGVLLGGHPKGKELSDSLLSIKDLLLVAFFLSIGMRGVPDLSAVGIALALLVVLPLKKALFFVLLTRLRLRARTAWVSASNLTTYSEFGLIVGAVAVGAGWLDPYWLTLLALAVAFSLLVSSPLAARAQQIHARLAPFLLRFENVRRLPEDQPLSTGTAEILVFGMGRVGSAAYDTLTRRYRGRVLGIDFDPSVVERHVRAGREVLRGDATDADFWERLCPETVGLVLLAMRNFAENSIAAELIRKSELSVRLSALARHPDEAERLKAMGVDQTFDLYGEAGSGFADHTCAALWECGSPAAPQ